MSPVPSSWRIGFDLALELVKTVALWLLFFYAVLALRAISQMPDRLDRLSHAVETKDGARIARDAQPVL